MYDYLFRIVVIGDSRAGKTALCERLAMNTFNDYIETTIGVEFQAMWLNTFDNLRIKCQIWDTSGCERFKSITKSYYRNIAAALVVFDVTDKESFYNMNYWISELKENNFEENLPKILIVGNKVDKISRRTISEAEARKYAKMNGFSYMEASAKNGLVYAGFKKFISDISEDEEFLKGNGVLKSPVKQTALKPRNSKWSEDCCRIM